MAHASPLSLWLRQVLALTGKEFAQIIRDPSSYLVAGVLPTLFLLLFGFGINLDPANLQLGICDESRSQASTALIADFRASPWFEVHELSSMAAVTQAMRDSRIQGFLHIREDFERNLLSLLSLEQQMAQRMKSGRNSSPDPDRAGRTETDFSSLQLVVDGTEPNSARFLQGYAQSVLLLFAQRLTGSTQSAGIDLVVRHWYNPTALSINFLVPGSITVIMTLIGTLLTSLVFAREWERGTMEAMLATPVTRMQLLLGKLVPYFCLGMFSLFLCTVLAINLFNVPYRGSFLALVVISSIFMLCALGQGLFISVHLRVQLVAAEAGLFTGFLPALLLSGFVFDLDSMPPLLQALAQILPATHFNICLRTLFLAGTIPAVLVPRTLCLLALASLLLVVVYRHLRKSID